MKNSIKIKETSDINYIKSNYGEFLKGDISPFPLIKAIIRNSLNEYKKNKEHNKIAITIDNNDNKITIIDNGSGFKCNCDETISKDFILDDVINKPVDKSRIIVNLQTVCIISSKTIISTINNDKIISYTIEDGILTREFKEKEINQKPFSTKITFYPDNRLIKFNVDKKNLIEYLTLMKKQNSDLMIALIYDREKIVITNKIKKRKKRSINKQKVLEIEKSVKKRIRNKNSLNDNFDIKSKSFIEAIYVEHLGSKVQSVGNVAHVYGDTEEELERRCKIISSIPLYLEYIKKSVPIVKSNIKGTTKEEKCILRLIKQLENIK